MAEPTPSPSIAQTAPYGVEVTAGRTYWWCACGLSKKQPFCDGTHKGSGMAPLQWTAPQDGQAWLCGCKHTATAPLCDGSHKAL